METITRVTEAQLDHVRKVAKARGVSMLRATEDMLRDYLRTLGKG